MRLRRKPTAEFASLVKNSPAYFDEPRTTAAHSPFRKQRTADAQERNDFLDLEKLAAMQSLFGGRGQLGHCRARLKHRHDATIQPRTKLISHAVEHGRFSSSSPSTRSLQHGATGI